MENVFGICTSLCKLKSDAYERLLAMMSDRMNQDYLEQRDRIKAKYPDASENELIRAYIEEEGWCIWDLITNKINNVEFGKGDYPFYWEQEKLFVRNRIPLNEYDAPYTLKQVEEILHRWIDPLLEEPVYPTWYSLE